MTPPRTGPDVAPTATAAGDQASDGEPGPAVRRAPFSDNPQVGARGQRTQQRILDASLEAFGDLGYHRTGIAQITKLAGCSRASFYQYFSDKDDVYRHLSGQVARQLSASVEALRPVTPDLDGWRELRAWVGRHGEIHDRYQPVWDAFPAAAESDEAVGHGAERTSERNVARLRSKLVTTELPPRKLDPILGLLVECLSRTQDQARTLRAVIPGAYPAERVDDALADVAHRALFGLRADVNARPAPGDRPPAIAFGPATREALRDDQEANPDLTAAGRRTLQGLLDAGRGVFVARGYHGTRVDDVVAAAGVSHGAFYRYFRSKDELAHVLAVRAIRHVSTAFTDIPDVRDDGPAGRAALRRWLRRYNATQSTETAMIQVWVDAAHQDAALRQDSAAALDWGRRALARFLAPREFGDVDIDAVVMVALLSGFGGHERPSAAIDAAAHIIERGLLGR
jgi:AcrR family transcriptional regulator